MRKGGDTAAIGRRRANRGTVSDEGDERVRPGIAISLFQRGGEGKGLFDIDVGGAGEGERRRRKGGRGGWRGGWALVGVGVGGVGVGVAASDGGVVAVATGTVVGEACDTVDSCVASCALVFTVLNAPLP